MAESFLNVVVLVGSLRRASNSRAIAQTLDELAPDDVAVTLLNSVGGLPHFDEDLEGLAFPHEVTTMGEAIARADAVVIVTPEYMGSIPGSLKNALDWLGRLPEPPLAGKPVAIQSAVRGRSTGAGCQSHLRQVLACLEAVTLARPEIAVSEIAGKVDVVTATLRDEDTRRHVAIQLQALADLARSRP